MKRNLDVLTLTAVVLVSSALVVASGFYIRNKINNQQQLSTIFCTQYISGIKNNSERAIDQSILLSKLVTATDNSDNFETDAEEVIDRIKRHTDLNVLSVSYGEMSGDSCIFQNLFVKKTYII